MPHAPPLKVKVWGELACFTRPEMKVERVSYPVMTPSAARGILEAIFWRPRFSWHVREIWVLNPIRHLSILRNEVNTRQSDRTARAWCESGGGFYVEDDRAQRHTIALRDVAYVVCADVDMRPAAGEHQTKYRQQFLRRVKRGRCFHRPYLGCREFAASFGEVRDPEEPTEIDEDLGLMLFDLRYKHDGEGKGIGAEPVFFRAKLERGVLRIPQSLYEEVGNAPGETV
jgi:CRISPR-associated protein Cas5d